MGRAELSFKMGDDLAVDPCSQRPVPPFAVFHVHQFFEEFEDGGVRLSETLAGSIGCRPIQPLGLLEAARQGGCLRLLSQVLPGSAHTQCSTSPPGPDGCGSSPGPAGAALD